MLILNPVRRGNVKFRVWDVAGQSKYRTLWERYCQGVNAIVFVVDSSDVRLSFSSYPTPVLTPLQHSTFEAANFALQQLLSQPPLAGVPLLVVSSVLLVQ